MAKSAPVSSTDFACQFDIDRGDHFQPQAVLSGLCLWTSLFATCVPTELEWASY